MLESGLAKPLLAGDGRAPPPCLHERRRATSGGSALPSPTSIDAPRCVGHAGAIPLVGDITAGEQERVNSRSSALLPLDGGAIDPAGPTCQWLNSIYGLI